VVYTDLLRLVRVRASAGKVSDFDVAQASAALDGARVAVQNAQQSYANARRTLEVLLGRYPAASIQSAKALAHPPALLAPDIPASIVAKRPDVVAAQQQVISAFRLNEADRLALLPGLSLQLDAGRYGDGLIKLLGLDPWLGRATIGMVLPIYEGGALRANIRISEQYQQQAVAQYGAAVLAALNEVESGLSDDYRLRRAIEASDQVLVQRNLRVRLARERYKAGASDMLTVLQLQARQIESEAVTIELRYACVSNWIKLNLALGESFDATPVLAQSSAQ
jgi:multidrug efflux system outer membrane protein